MAVAEEATTGALELKELFPKDELPFPVVKVNDFLTKSEFDIVYVCCHLLNDGVMRVRRLWEARVGARLWQCGQRLHFRSL